MYWLVTICILTLFLYHLIKRERCKKKCKMKYPPSPPRFPIIGNLHHMVLSGTPPHQTFTDLAKSLGPVFTMWFGDAPVVIINDYYIAKETLMSRQCHGRPQRESGRIISNNFNGLITTDAGKTLQYRKAILKRVLEKNERNFQHVLEEGVKSLVETINQKLQASEDGRFGICDEITSISYNIVTRMAFSETLSIKGELFHKLKQIMHWLTVGLTLNNLFQGFPFLKNVPLGRILFLDLYKKEMFGIISQFYNQHHQRFEKTKLKDLTDLLIDEEIKNVRPMDTTDANYIISRENIEVILSDIVVTSLDTVASTLRLVILYLSHYTSYAKQCREEIEQTLSKGLNKYGQLSSSFDFNQFHFLRAFVSETMRQRTIAPLGVPHKTVEDMELSDGHTIPKNTTVFINIHGIHHDHKLHQDASGFKPERFLDANGKYQNIDGYLPFSKGRRQCLGQTYAMKAIMYCTVEVIKNFDFTLCKDINFSKLFKYQTTLSIDSFVLMWKHHYKKFH